MPIENKRMSQLVGKYENLDTTKLVKGEIAIPDDHNPIVKLNNGKIREFVTQDGVDWFEGIIENYDKIHAEMESQVTQAASSASASESYANVSKTEADRAKQEADRAFHTTPEGYEELVEKVELRDIFNAKDTTFSLDTAEGGIRLNRVEGTTVKIGTLGNVFQVGEFGFSFNTMNVQYLGNGKYRLSGTNNRSQTIYSNVSDYLGTLDFVAGKNYTVKIETSDKVAGWGIYSGNWTMYGNSDETTLSEGTSGMKFGVFVNENVSIDVTFEVKILGESYGLFQSGDMGLVDLGGLEWSYNSTYKIFMSSVISSKKVSGIGYSNIYNVTSNRYTAIGDKEISTNNVGYTGDNCLLVKDSSYTDVVSFKAMLQKEKVQLAYELAEGVTPAKYALVVKEQGKNLLNRNNFKSNVTISSNGIIVSDSYYGLYYVPIKAGHKYFMSRKQDESGSNGVVWGITDSIPNAGNVSTYNGWYRQNNNFPVNPTNDGYFVIRDRIDGTHEIGTGTEWQFEENDSATSYVPAKSNITFIPLDKPLNSNDYIDVKDGIEHREYGEVDLGDLNWDYNKYFEAGINLNYDASATQWVVPNGYNTANYDNVAMFYIVNDNSRIDKAISWYNDRIRITDSTYTDKEAFKQVMKGVKLVYELATPTDTPLTSEQIKACNSLVSYKDKTYIDTADEYAKATLDVAYSAYEVASELLDKSNRVEVLEVENEELNHKILNLTYTDISDYFAPYDNRVRIDYIKALYRSDGKIDLHIRGTYIKNTTSSQNSMILITDGKYGINYYSTIMTIKNMISNIIIRPASSGEYTIDKTDSNTQSIDDTFIINITYFVKK